MINPKRYKRRTVPEDENEEASAQPETNGSGAPPDVTEDYAKLLDYLIDRLPRVHRTVLEYKLEQRSHAEIAQAFGKTIIWVDECWNYIESMFNKVRCERYCD